jgi:quercetin dioxygenase-like cupin family protein
MAIQGLVAAATQVKVVQPGGGRRGHLAPGVDVIFKIDGEDTGGLLSIVEHPFEVGALVPPHTHALEDEYSIVLEGEIGFRSNDQEVVLGPGGYIIKPRGQVHAMWNAGSTRARMIEVISPAGFERFFRDFVELTDVGRPDFAVIAELGARYQLPFAQPEWLADVIARYNLTPPPA